MAPQVAESIVAFVATAMVEAGVPPGPVRAHVASLGVSQTGIGRVAWTSYRDLWALAQALHPVADLGIRVAEHVPFGARDLADFVLKSASTLGDVARITLELTPLLDDSIVASVEPLQDAMLLRAARAPGMTVPDAMSDYAMARLVGTLRDLTADRLVPERVFLTRPAPPDPARHEDYFGCGVHFGHAFDGMQVPSAWMERRIPGADDALHHTLLRHTRRALRRPPDRGVRMVERVRHALSELIDEGRDVQQEQVARRLGQSPRTLRRALAEEGVPYADLYDQARLEYAQAALRAGASIESVAVRLGFSSPGSFGRTFRRWTGRPPDAWRRGAE